MFDDMYNRFDTVYKSVTDRQTDRRTEVPYRYRASEWWRAIKTKRNMLANNRLQTVPYVWMQLSLYKIENSKHTATITQQR